MEKILSICEYSEEDNMEGYVITTNKQVIKLLIDSVQRCCENWGYFMSEDDFNYFIGAELLNIKITDTALNKVKIDELNLYEGSIMFVDIETNKGVLQFVAYNKHNGYYGHGAKVISEQLNHEEWL